MLLHNKIDTRNGFTFLRILAALTVIFTHCYGAAGIDGDLLTSWGTYPLSKFGVDTFFAISGFLVTQSILRNPSVPQYFLSRALRILPGLFVSLLVAIFAASFFFNNTNYYAEAGVWRYLWNITLYFPEPIIPGTFAGNHTTVVNGALWTLPLEVACYIGLACLAWGDALQKRFVAVCIIFLILLHFWGGIPRDLYIFKMQALFLNNLSVLFFVGCWLALIEKKLPVSPWYTLAAFIAVVFAYQIAGSEWKISSAFHLTLLPYIVITFAIQAKKLHFLNRFDISYGLYIYGFIVQQCLEAYFHQIGFTATPMQYFGATTAITVVVAYASWKLVEQPALRLKGSFLYRSRNVVAAQSVRTEPHGSKLH